MSQPTLPTRTPGRPQADSADQRARLLDAALLRFAEAGVAATNLREVAKAAGVTPALVNYYFGGKDALVAAVFAERFLPVLAELPARLAQAPTSDLIGAFVRGVHELVARHPWLPAIWVREILTGNGAFRDGMLSEAAPRLVPVLTHRFADLQRAGQLNAELDPRLMIVSLIGLTLFPLAAKPMWSQFFDARDIGPDLMTRHTLALLTRGLEMRHDP